MKIKINVELSKYITEDVNMNRFDLSYYLEWNYPALPRIGDIISNITSFLNEEIFNWLDKMNAIRYLRSPYVDSIKKSPGNKISLADWFGDGNLYDGLFEFTMTEWFRDDDGTFVPNFWLEPR